MLAEASHRRSARSSKPFVRVNCARVPSALLEGERAAVLCTGDWVEVSHLPVECTLQSLPPAAEEVDPTKEFSHRSTPLRDELRHAARSLERERVVVALERCAGNQSSAARVLGISRRTLVARLSEYRIPRPIKDKEC